MKRLLGFLLGSDEPSPGQIARATRQVMQPHGDASVRVGAFDRLRAWGTPEAIRALLRRFTIQTPSGAVDIEECQQVEAMLVGLGEKAVKPILDHLEREPRVSYPARALEQIVPKEQFVTYLLEVLDKLDAGFSSSSEQRSGLLRILEEVDDPRIAPGVRRFLEDPSDDVVVAALACVVRSADPSFRDDLVELLIRSADRPRVRQEVAEQLQNTGWPMEERRKDVQANLPEGFLLDKRGRVVAG